jgi:DNA-binding NarL/FixJ family response regulator
MLRKPTTTSVPGQRRRILIIDDHPLARRGLVALINVEPDLVVCAEAATEQDGLVAIAVARPELVISDLSHGHNDGLDLVRAVRARHSGLRVLVLSVHDSPLYVRRAFAAGADGYVIKHQMTERLLPAIRRVLRGGRYGDPES